MENNLKNIKTYFSVIIILIIIIIFGGNSFLKRNTFFSARNFGQIFNYFKYKASFAYGSNKNLTASVISIFQNNNQVNQSEGYAKSIPVLLYHGIVKVPDRFSVSLKTFRDQMFSLKKAGYQTISIEDLISFKKGEKELPEKSFLLTFDDGRLDSYMQADSLLKALNYTAVMFVATEDSVPQQIKKKSIYYISVNDIKNMISSKRWEIGSHAIQETGGQIKISEDGKMGNFLSNKKWLDDGRRFEDDAEYLERITREIQNSKAVLEKEFNIHVSAFSYPYGDYGQQTMNNSSAPESINTLIKENYSLAFKQIWPNEDEYTSNYKDTDSYFLKRIETPTDWSGKDLLDKLNMIEDKQLPFTDPFSETSGWIKTWGNFNIHDNAIYIGAHDKTTGSSIFLDGTREWQDYVLKANVNLTKGQTFSLMARYKDGENYAACIFSDKYIRMEQSLGGKKEILAELGDNFSFTSQDQEVGIGVYDNVVNCYLGGQILMKGYNLDASLDHGGIGFKTWDPEMGNSELVIKSVSVEEIK